MKSYPVQRTNLASSRGTASSAIVLNRTPRHLLSWRLHVVTQWKSLTSSTCGRRRNSSQVSVNGFSTSPPTSSFHCTRVDVGLLTEIEHRPVLHLVLADGQLRHPVSVCRPRAGRRPAAELHVDRALVELDLPLNVLLPPLDQIRLVRAYSSMIAAGRLGSPIHHSRGREYTKGHKGRVRFITKTRARRTAGAPASQGREVIRNYAMVGGRSTGGSRRVEGCSNAAGAMKSASPAVRARVMRPRCAALSRYMEWSAPASSVS